MDYCYLIVSPPGGGRGGALKSPCLALPAFKAPSMTARVLSNVICRRDGPSTIKKRTVLTKWRVHKNSHLYLQAVGVIAVDMQTLLKPKMV